MDVRPAIATVTAAPVPRDDTQHRYHTPPLRSQNGAEQRATKKRSTNQVRPRPANPAVISSIIDSFDALTPPPSIHANDYHSETGSLGSKRTRPDSPSSTIASAPSIARSMTSPGFGMEYGSSLALSDDTGSADAAPPPSIRTSRPPSGLTRYNTPSPSRFNSDVSGAHLRPASLNSRTSSFCSVTREKENGARNKHSAESWIKQNTISQESFTSSGHKGHRKSLRRINSQETLRQPRIEDLPAPLGAAELYALSRAEQIIARTPPPLADNKGRLYLTDSCNSEEKVPRDSLLSQSKDQEVAESPKSGQKSPVSPISDSTASTAQTTPTPKRISPAKSAIVDSIPIRTSSLRATSSSPASGKKKDKKLKRQTVSSSKTEDLTERSQSIPESSWADLGEDDETVKRIRELREKRKSRIEELQHFSIVAEIPQIPQEAANTPPVPERSAQRSEDPKRASSRVRPLTSRAATEPPLKAHRILGITDDKSMPGFTGLTNISASTGSRSPERLRRPYSRKQEKLAPLTQSRPGTASSPTPPLSLDYSYAQAVDALQGAERELEKREKVHKRSPSSKNSLTLKALDLPDLQPVESPPTPVVRPRPKSARRRPDSQSRWTSHHPDLPLELDRRKSRRKSMSDARRTRQFEEEAELERRDSIEDAVLEYLQAPRLSRRVQHPLTRRVISFSEVGDPNGAAVFICVGMGLTRYVTAFYDELATTLRLRLITVDRPGVGGSEPYPQHDRSGPLSWPDDILAICQHLGITKFSMVAHSAGAIYALATALILPHLINGKVHLLAPWIPPSQLEAISHPTATAPPAGALPRSQRILRVLPTSFLKAANSSFMNATSASLKPASKKEINAARERQRLQSTSPSPAKITERPATAQRPDYHRRESMMLMDQFMPTTNPMESFPIPVNEEEEDNAQMRRGSLFLSATATPTDPTFTFAQTALSAAEHAEREHKLEYTSRLTQRTWELATRDSNPATDLLVCLERNREIGFRYTDVSREVVITHGSEDKRVPVANVKWLCDQMNARASAGSNVSLGGDSIPSTREGWADTLTSRGGCEVRLLEGEGHGLMASAPIMSDILTEIAGYWAGHDKGRFTM